MKKSDLKEGEEYAYATRRDPYYATRVRLLHIDQLYTTTRDSYNGPVTGFKPAPPHITRPKRVSSWSGGNDTGYPVQDVQSDRKFVVDTRNLLSTWEDWLVHREQKQAEEKAASIARAATKAQHEQDVQTIRTLLKERGLQAVSIDFNYFSGTVTLRKSDLISLLSSFPTPEQRTPDATR